MPECAYNKQDSEYVSGPKMPKSWKYGKGLNMAGFSACERYTVFWICQNVPWQSSECISGSKYARIPNMAGF